MDKWDKNFSKLDSTPQWAIQDIHQNQGRLEQSRKIKWRYQKNFIIGRREYYFWQQSEGKELFLKDMPKKGEF